MHCSCYCRTSQLSGLNYWKRSMKVKILACETLRSKPGGASPSDIPSWRMLPHLPSQESDRWYRWTVSVATRDSEAPFHPNWLSFVLACLSGWEGRSNARYDIYLFNSFSRNIKTGEGWQCTGGGVATLLPGHRSQFKLGLEGAVHVVVVEGQICCQRGPPFSQTFHLKFLFLLIFNKAVFSLQQM